MRIDQIQTTLVGINIWTGHKGKRDSRQWQAPAHAPPTGLYIQVLVGVVIGVALGHFWPAFAVQMQPFGDAFIKPGR
jgi:hypothetical protein